MLLILLHALLAARLETGALLNLLTTKKSRDQHGSIHFVHARYSWNAPCHWWPLLQALSAELTAINVGGLSSSMHQLTVLRFSEVIKSRPRNSKAENPKPSVTLQSLSKLLTSGDWKRPCVQTSQHEAIAE